ncbi:MAG: hypothetical protein VKS61_16500 [Candidatus Sericytochromatia bacterium]|nr:hypothetical protein [Candidatus Sericytochromatia bacterium]
MMPPPLLVARVTLAFACVVTGCAQPPSGARGLPPPEPERVVRAGQYRPTIAPNRGRLVGTVTLDQAAAAGAGLASLNGGQAEALDYADEVLAGPAPVDEAGHFVLEGLKPSRDKLLVRVRLPGTRASLRLTALAVAPRKVIDSPVLLSAASTLVADRLRRGQQLRELEVDMLDAEALARLEDVAGAFLDASERLAVPREAEASFNAFAYDHLMDDHPGLKRLTWELAPGLLRGWRPPAERFGTPPTPPPAPPSAPPGNRVGPPVIPGVTS